MVTVGVLDTAVLQSRQLCSGEGGSPPAGGSFREMPSGELRLLRRCYDEAFIKLLVPHHPVFQQPFRLFGPAATERQISLVHFAVAEHLGKPLQGLARLREHDQPAYGAVEAVRYSHENPPRLVVPEGHESLQGLAQGLVAGLVALHYLSRAFVENEQVIVFIDYAALKVVEFFRVRLPVNHGAKIMTICQKTAGGTRLVDSIPGPWRAGQKDNIKNRIKWVKLSVSTSELPTVAWQ